MNMYLWRSEAFKEYRKGYIMVMAPSIEEAREKAKARVRVAAKDHTWPGAFFFCNYAGTKTFDADDWETYNERLAIFDKDVDAEPELVSDQCAFIPGGE